MPDINSVSFTFENGVKREEYGPTKKASATITAAVGQHEDGAAVLDAIAFIATNKVRVALSIEGATAPTAAPPPAVAQPSPTAAPEPAQVGEGQAAPASRIRRTEDEKARGLTVEQAAAERAARAAGDPSDTSASATDAPLASQDQPTSTLQQSSPPSESGPVVDDWDQTEVVTITDAQINEACSSTAGRLGDGGGAKVRAIKELYNPKPGEPFRFVDIGQEHRAAVLEKLAALT